MKLSEFLGSFDFSYEKTEDGKYKLIDMQGVNFGGIEDEVFENIQCVVDRLDIYYTDYIYEGVCDEGYNGEENYGDILEWLCLQGNEFSGVREIVECIVNSDLLQED